MRVRYTLISEILEKYLKCFFSLLFDKPEIANSCDFKYFKNRTVNQLYMVSYGLCV